MRKRLLTLVGTAALTSMLTVSAATPLAIATTTRIHSTEKSRKGKRGNFSSISATEKADIHEKMSEDLAQVIGTTKDSILAELNAGKTPKDIITASGKDISVVQASLDALHTQKMTAKIQAEVTVGKITQAKADEMIKKMTERK